jgi:hypothetical protein
MASKTGDGVQDLRVGQVESRIRKVDWLWGQIKEKQKEIRLLENELMRTEAHEYMDDDSRLDETQKV